MNFQHDLRLARALYQLTIYFTALQLPFTLKELYLRTYGELWEEAPGAPWLDHLAQDPAVTMARDDFYTLYTIMETLHQSGLGLLLRTLEEETAQLGIGVGLMKAHIPRRPRRDEGDRG